MKKILILLFVIISINSYGSVNLFECREKKVKIDTSNLIMEVKSGTNWEIKGFYLQEKHFDSEKLIYSDFSLGNVANLAIYFDKSGGVEQVLYKNPSWLPGTSDISCMKPQQPMIE
ncbi:hypothetical protein N9W41_00535 [bacterium]|nr:hypothetical protein [bacterium]